MKTRLLFFTLFCALFCLSGLTGDAWRTAQAQTVPTTTQLFLPLVTNGKAAEGESPLTTPYAQQLAAAGQQCADTPANHVCLGSGVMDGFAQVGASVPLTGVTTLAVHSPSPAVADWTVLLLRLQAPGEETITKTLDVLAVGHVDLTALHLFTGTVTNPVSMSAVPQLHMASQPLGEGDTRAPSGLILHNPQDELLSIAVNGAGVTLGSTAFVQAQPGVALVVNLREGSALVQAAGAAHAVVAGSQVTVPLDEQGTVAGMPGEPTEYDDELIVPLLTPAQVTYNELSARLSQALLQCRLANNPKRVYRAFYFARQLNTAAMRRLMSQAVWDGYAELIKRCARFEVIFDATITGDTTADWSDQLHSDGAFVQFDYNGNLVAWASAPARHLQVSATVPVCSVSAISAPEGTFRVEAASLKLFYNTFRIALSAFPYLEPVRGTITCPAPAPATSLTIEWNTMFLTLHPDLWTGTPPYSIGQDAWHYTGRRIFAEAIFADRSAPVLDGTIRSTSYFILRHAPLE